MDRCPGSGLSDYENLRRTKEIVEMCHPLGISVEAELGAIGGEEGGGLVGEADKSLFTDPDQAAEFVEFTGMSQVALKVLKEGMNKTGNSYNDYPFANDES